jgi:signal transduction histidine kinase
MQGIPRRLRALDPARADALLAFVLFLVGVVELTVEESDAPIVDAISFGGLALLLSQRRRAPIGVMIAIAAGIAALEPVAGVLTAGQTAFGIFVAAAYWVGAHVAGTRPVVLAGAACTALLSTSIFTSEDQGGLVDVFFIGMFAVGAPVVVGRLVRQQVQLSAELAEKNRLIELEREERARAAVLAERSRIARDLHDVVAHSVSVMVVQAAGVRRVLAGDPERAATGFRAIETTGRDALGEMRRLLGMLRPDDEPVHLAPQPGMERIEELVERTRAAGVEVDLNRSGEPTPLAAGLDVAAYRVVQEALTNAIKHAAGSRVAVGVEYLGSELRVAVVDDGAGSTAEIGGSGRGLDGMRERVALYGGTLDAGRRPGGGFAVTACFPLQSEVLA